MTSTPLCCYLGWQDTAATTYTDFVHGSEVLGLHFISSTKILWALCSSYYEMVVSFGIFVLKPSSYQLWVPRFYILQWLSTFDYMYNHYKNYWEWKVTWHCSKYLQHELPFLTNSQHILPTIDYSTAGGITGLLEHSPHRVTWLPTMPLSLCYIHNWEGYLGVGDCCWSSVDRNGYCMREYPYLGLLLSLL